MPLELFHGPTHAFKDVGARFCRGCYGRSVTSAHHFVATSGDTGARWRKGF